MTPVIRPPRTTTRLGIPIPGDAAPADFVTAAGAIADAIDGVVPRIQAGMQPAFWAGVNEGSSEEQVTFPTPFANVLLAITLASSISSPGEWANAPYLHSEDLLGFIVSTVAYQGVPDNTNSARIYWIAVGY